jgi:hypothetical protein
LPNVLVLYAAEGDKFPTSAQAQAALAHDAALTYEFLLRTCPAKYPQIVIPGPGAPRTTPAQNAANFEAIANCAYAEYTAKPYWIPALVDKVDICGNELGPDWHLPTEDEVNDLSESQRRSIAGALATPNASSYFGHFYFSLQIWVRGTNGSLRQGDLSPPPPDVCRRIGRRRRCGRVRGRRQRRRPVSRPRQLKGRRTMKVQPWFGPVSKEMVPPCASMTARAT